MSGDVGRSAHPEIGWRGGDDQQRKVDLRRSFGETGNQNVPDQARADGADSQEGRVSTTRWAGGALRRIQVGAVTSTSPEAGRRWFSPPPLDHPTPSGLPEEAHVAALQERFKQGDTASGLTVFERPQKIQGDSALQSPEARQNVSYPHDSFLSHLYPPPEAFKAFEEAEARRLPRHDPLAHLSHPPGVLEALKESEDKYLPPYAKLHGISVEECKRRLDEHVRTILEGAQPWVRFTPEGFAGFLRDGSYKNRFEGVPTASTIENGKYTVWMEEALFGYSRDCPPELRPIYLYLSNSPVGKGTYVDGFGPIAVRLNLERIRDRLTFTIGDSGFLTRGLPYPRGLFVDGLPQRLDEPNYRAIVLSRLEIEHALHRELNHPAGTWAEGQYHRFGSTPEQVRPLTPDDVVEVVLHLDGGGVPEKYYDLFLRDLDARGIPYFKAPPGDPLIFTRLSKMGLRIVYSFDNPFEG